jgi:dimethylargininase
MPSGDLEMSAMNGDFGAHSMIDPLRSVLVRRPDEAYAVRDAARWNYARQPRLAVAQREHDALTDILRRNGVEVIYHDLPQPGRADAIFVHDPAIVLDQGALILSPGKDLRRGEERAMAKKLEQLGIPIMGRLTGAAIAEGGDLLWLDANTLAVGRGFRTNQAGVEQIGRHMSRIGVHVISVPLPYHTGAQSCLHLQSLISLLDERTAAIYAPLIPVSFYELLVARGFRFVHIPAQEFETMGPNILAIAPGKLIMLEGNPITRGRLEAMGYTVSTYKGEELSLPSEGGATCLTRPILRRN